MRVRTILGPGLAALAAAVLSAAPGLMTRAAADSDAVPPSVVQIIAHPDDDLLFQEPDTKQTYVWPSTSVYITGGDATNHAGPGKTFPDVCAYSASRFQGLRDAHERGVANPTWTKRAINVNNHVIEEDTLDQRPDIKLVFLRLHEAGDGHYSSGSDGFYNLYDLFYGSKTGLREWSLGTDAVDGADCDQQYAHQYYTKDDLTTTLTGIMQHYRASTVLTLDPYRDFNREHNIDHYGAAAFTGEAVLGWHGPDGRGHIQLRDYRTYSDREDPANLDPNTSADKQQDFLAYVGPNTNPPNQPYKGKNDPEPNPYNDFYTSFVHRQYPRWSNGVSWAALDAYGRLTAVALLDSKPQIWREQAVGGPWSGPTLLPGGVTMAAALSLVRDDFGMLHVVGTRLSDSRVITIAETAPGVWGSWQVLGTPSPDRPNVIGNPAVAVGRDGRLTVFVRNAGTGVSALSQRADGSWPTDWADLKGYTMRYELAAILAPDGHLELFGPSDGGIRHWRQDPDAGTWALDPGPLGPVSAGPVSVTRNADGRLQIFYVQADTGHIATQWQRPGGSWTTTPGVLGLIGVEGVAVNPGSDGRMTLATRNAGGGVSLLVQEAPNIGFGNSPDLGGVILGAPAVVVDAYGRQTVLAFERDAALHVARQTDPGAGSPYGGWELAG